MTATLTERKGAKKTCASCGLKFVDRTQTGRRVYCETCSPLRAKRNAAATAPKTATVSGKPFTVEHFRCWSQRFRLKDGRLFVLEIHEERFLRDLFARDDAGLPVFSELWFVIPEGNGKTTFFALVVLYTIEFSPEAWVPVAASARDQAVDLTYRIAAGFVERNKLQGSFRLHPGYRQIIHRKSLGAAKIFASDAASGDGVDPTLALIEELHRLPKMDLYETWAGKLDKSHGQLVIASTAGEPGGAFEELRERIRQSAVETTREECYVRAATAGVVLHEYALPEGADPEDLELVAKANPASWKTVEALTKKRATPSWRLSHWLRFTCNLPTRSDAAAIMEAEWDAAAAAGEWPADGTPVWAGLDLAWKWDTTALVPLWVRDPEFRLLGPAEILTPPRDGTSLDPLLVERMLRQAHERNPLHTVVMDTTSGEQLAEWISSELGARVVDRSQGNAMMALDYARFMEALRSGWLKHSGDAGLRRHALNAVTRMLPLGDARFDRPRSTRAAAGQDSRVIDALVAAAMVHSTAVADMTAEPAASWRAY